MKISLASEPISAIRSVLLGESYLCSRIALIRKKSHYTSTALQSKDISTKREWDVLQAVVKGLSTHKIVHLLGISENTVGIFREELLSKFGAKNAIDLAVKVASQGWVSVQ